MSLPDDKSVAQAEAFLPVCVPPDILAGLEAVRRDARVSMGDVQGVIEIGFLLGYPQLEAWLQANQQAYAHGCFFGFVADQTEHADTLAGDEQ